MASVTKAAFPACALLLVMALAPPAAEAQQANRWQQQNLEILAHGNIDMSVSPPMAQHVYVTGKDPLPCVPGDDPGGPLPIVWDDEPYRASFAPISAPFVGDPFADQPFGPPRPLVDELPFDFGSVSIDLAGRPDPGPAPIPEPATAILMTLALAAGLRRRR